MSEASAPERIVFDMRSNVSFPTLRSEANVRFFGNVLGIACRKCGAYEQTKAGHHYCVHVSCPIGLLESKHRNRPRTSSLEKVFVPRLATRDRAEPVAGAPSAPQ